VDSPDLTELRSGHFSWAMMLKMTLHRISTVFMKIPMPGYGSEPLLTACFFTTGVWIDLRDLVTMTPATIA
jgi:hypothetical protein